MQEKGIIRRLKAYTAAIITLLGGGICISREGISNIVNWSSSAIYDDDNNINKRYVNFDDYINSIRFDCDNIYDSVKQSTGVHLNKLNLKVFGPLSNQIIKKHLNTNAEWTEDEIKWLILTAENLKSKIIFDRIECNSADIFLSNDYADGVFTQKLFNGWINVDSLTDASIYIKQDSALGLLISSLNQDFELIDFNYILKLLMLVVSSDFDIEKNENGLFELIEVPRYCSDNFNQTYIDCELDAELSYITNIKINSEDSLETAVNRSEGIVLNDDVSLILGKEGTFLIRRHLNTRKFWFEKEKEVLKNCIIKARELKIASATKQLPAEKIESIYNYSEGSFLQSGTNISYLMSLYLSLSTDSSDRDCDEALEKLILVLSSDYVMNEHGIICEYPLYLKYNCPNIAFSY